MSDKKVICGLCACNCILKASFSEDGNLQSIKGDKDSIHGGFACIKGLSIKEIAKGNNRLTTPLLKQADGSFKPISIEEALDIIAYKMLEIKSDWGASSFAIHSGQAGVRRQFSRLTSYFAELFGSVNYSGIGTTCNVSKRLAYSLTFGALPKCDFKKSKTIVLWGYNAPNTHPYDWNVIKKSVKEGANLVVINPQVTGACQKGALHLPIQPGTDIYLAWAMLKIAVSNKWHNIDFLEESAIGFADLMNILEDIDAEQMCEICGLDFKSVYEATQLIFFESPSTIMVGTAVELQQYGFQSCRSIAILQALTGTEGLLFSKMPSYQPFPAKPQNKGKRVGADKYPEFTNFVNYAQTNVLSKSIESGEIKGLLVVGGNPLLTWADANENIESLRKLDFLVVIDTYFTATAKEADIIIPAASPGEKYELIECVSSEGDVFINLTEPILPPLGLNEVEIFHELAKRLGFVEDFPWASSLEFFNYLLEPLNINCEQLMQNPNGYHFSSGGRWSALKEKHPKVKLKVESLTRNGHHSLPIPPKHPQTSEGYAILTTCDKHYKFVHSRYRTVKNLGDQQEVFVKLSTNIADSQKILTGDLVKISRNGSSVLVHAEVKDTIANNVAILTHGWESANMNAFTSLDELDEVTGFPNAARIEVKIEKYRS